MGPWRLGHCGRRSSVRSAAIAGHRTTYGRPLHDIDRLRPGDTIVVETKTTYSVYAVKRHGSVPPGRVDVLSPVPQKVGAKARVGTLTMTACHPKSSAAQRYVVFAELVGTHSRSEGLPAGTLDAPRGSR